MRLTRALVGALAAGVAAVLLLAGGQQPALAGGGPGGGLFGGVTCDKSYSPQCTVTAGSGPSAGTPASAGTGTGSHRRPGRPPPGAALRAGARAR